MVNQNRTPGSASQRSSPHRRRSRERSRSGSKDSDSGFPARSPVVSGNLADIIAAQSTATHARFEELIALFKHAVPLNREASSPAGQTQGLSVCDLLTAFNARDKVTLTKGPRLRKFFEDFLREVAHVDACHHRTLLAARVSGPLVAVVDDAYSRLGPQSSVSVIAEDILSYADPDSARTARMSDVVAALQLTDVKAYVLAFRLAMGSHTLSAKDVGPLFLAGLSQELRVQFRGRDTLPLAQLLLEVRDHCVKFPAHAKLAWQSPPTASVASSPMSPADDVEVSVSEVDAILCALRRQKSSRQCALACDDKRPHTTAGCPWLAEANRHVARTKRRKLFTCQSGRPFRHWPMPDARVNSLSAASYEEIGRAHV